MRHYIRQSKLSTTKAEKANIELVPKKAKKLPYMEQSCNAPNVIFQTFFPTDNTLFYNQCNEIYSLQQRNTVDFGLWS